MIPARLFQPNVELGAPQPVSSAHWVRMAQRFRPVAAAASSAYPPTAATNSEGFTYASCGAAGAAADAAGGFGSTDASTPAALVASATAGTLAASSAWGMSSAWTWTVTDGAP